MEGVVGERLGGGEGRRHRAMMIAASDGQDELAADVTVLEAVHRRGGVGERELLGDLDPQLPPSISVPEIVELEAALGRTKT